MIFLRAAINLQCSRPKWRSRQHAADVFASAAERNSEPDTVLLNDVYAKIGQQPLEMGH